MARKFVHLRLHSEYSLVDGLVRIDALAESVAAAGMPAVAVTDRCNLFSLVKLYQQASARGIKPVAGVEVIVAGDDPGALGNTLVLLCRDQTGYRNLARLVTRSNVEGQGRGVPVVQRAWLSGHTAGLIALSAAAEGDVGQALISGNRALAETRLVQWLELFPDRYYLELHRTGRANEELHIDGALTLAQSLSVPVVATNDVRFLNADEFEAHEARVCIQQGRALNDPRRPRDYSPEQYLKTTEQMLELFHDIPEAVENAFLIAQRCTLELTLGQSHLPDFPVPAGQDQNSWLRHEAERGLERLFSTPAAGLNSTDRPRYQERLDSELGVITGMGFSGYFLIVADFIRWAKQRSIPVGPGRGSGAGSLVAYALDVTELDPLRYDLLFERFLNPERISLPDFDVDFCMDRRDEVIDYVIAKYGRDRVSHIITYGSMAAKAVVRDVGRVLGYPYGFVDKVAKLIPFDPNMTLDRALKEEDALAERYRSEEEVRILIDLAQKLEGLARNAGRHAGGIVIAPRPLEEFMPLYCEPGGHSTATQFDMGDAEAVGLVKFDLLGLRTLTIIDWAVRDAAPLRAAQGLPALDIRSIPLDDAASYQLIQRMETTAVFQLESDGMRKLIRRLKPDTFDDLVALVALFRPGPLQSGMVDDFVDRKHGKARVEYFHQALRGILAPTYGVILYQEQVMQIAQVLAGYTLGAADLLRRAMGKKKPEEMAKQRSIFTAGAREREVPEALATHIFDLMEKFAGYGFNKSHSAAYALLAYQTAWLKAHYPAAFMAAVLSADMDNTDKIVTLRHEVGRMGMELLPPGVNDSVRKFQVVNVKTIRFGLGAIKGVGASAIDSIVSAREGAGPFTDLFDLARRVDLRRANKRVLEALIRCGAADGLGPGRSTMLATLDKALQFAGQCVANSDTGQNDMFGLQLAVAPPPDDVAGADARFVHAEPWNEKQRLDAEKDTLGFYLKGHPIQRYEVELQGIVTRPLRELRPGNVTVAGYIDSLRVRSGNRGKMADFQIDDRTARAHVRLYSEVYQRYYNVIIADQLVIIRGEVVEDDYYQSGCAIIAREIYTLDQERTRGARLKLRVGQDLSGNGLVAELQQVLAPHRPGPAPVVIEYNNQSATVTLTLGNQWRVTLTDRLLDSLTVMLGEDNVRVQYPRGATA
ncbi:MAG: DNA polymerase III subunit alpha [Gammaproteobacteria bacterium RIFCSPLOWO2_02_FULL_61_13]|nr:MAG: DNA polymerase III subunit alpha [Gammaproteobacteria bacterium RIFCSPLOWO2_02_FULL_61_13]